MNFSAGGRCATPGTSLVDQVSQTHLLCPTSPSRRLACSPPLDLRSRKWRRCSARQRPGQTAPAGSQWTPSWSLPPHVGSLPPRRPPQSDRTTLTGPQAPKSEPNPPCGWGGRQRVSSASGKFSGLFSCDGMNTNTLLLALCILQRGCGCGCGCVVRQVSADLCWEVLK